MTGIAALAIGAAFTSCSKEVEQLSQEELDQIEIQKIKANYEQAFIKTFGQPASNQDWGFGAANARTRTAQTNSNQWGTDDWDGRYKNFPRPADITPEERAAVLAVFNQKGAESYTDLVNWSNFFVQQVYCGPNGEKMNQLACKDPAGHEVTEYLWSQERGNYTNVYTSYDDEVNNFNGGKYSGNAEQGCMLMFNSSTSEWSFKTSQSGGERIYGHWRMEYIPGYGYYVGLDHEAWRQAPANANEEDKRDFIYNDWIIKIVPGLGTILEPDLRIIAEDLSAGEDDDDFDFNDVVIDVYYGDAGKAKAKILAAGGTLQLRVDGKEVHDEFSRANNNIDCAGKMINTNGTNSADANVRSKSLDGLTAPEITLSNEVKTPIQARDNIKIEVFKNNQWIELEAVIGKVASKVRVGTDYTWKDERQYVGDSFKAFVSGNASYDEWYQNQ